MEKRNSNYFCKNFLGKQDPAARCRVTVAFLARAGLGWPTSPAEQPHAGHEGGESPALGRATSRRTCAPVSLREELLSCIDPFAGLFWDSQRRDLGNRHSALLDASTVSAKKAGVQLWTRAVCGHTCTYALSSGANYSGTGRRQIMTNFGLLKKKLK